MPFFEYTASDREGKLRRGQIEAPDKLSASHGLSAQGLFVMSVGPAQAPPPPPPVDDEELPLRKKLEAIPIEPDTVAVDTVRKISLPQRSWSSMDRALYLRQLQVMFAAGIPLYRAAASLAEGGEYNMRVLAKLREVPADLERGRSLSKSLDCSGLFTRLIVSSVRLGEESGRLQSILAALSDNEEQSVQLRRALISRLTYPAVVMTAMVSGLLVLGHVMSRVIASTPAFAKASSASLLGGHLMTLFRHPAFLPAMVFLGALLFMAGRKLWRRHRVRLLLEGIALRFPIVGPLLRRLEANSVTAHLALLVRSGLGIDRGLGLCADLVRTLSFRRALLTAQEEIRAGEELAHCLQRTEVFPEDVLALVQAGELSGSLEQSLETASRYCAEQVERTLESALAALEPLLIGLLGIAIGAVLILTFVPIFSTLQEL